MEVVRCLVDDVDRALPFYKTLGFRLIDRLDTSFVVLKGRQLVLWLCRPPAVDGRAPPVGTALRAEVGHRLVLEVADLDEAVSRLQEHGAEIAAPIREGRGGREVLICDPSGNAIELFEPTRDGAASSSPRTRGEAAQRHHLPRAPGAISK